MELRRDPLGQQLIDSLLMTDMKDPDIVGNIIDDLVLTIQTHQVVAFKMMTWVLLFS